MAITALVRVNLKEAVGDLGDRYGANISSSCIANDEWHIEADYRYGSIGDVTIYRNTTANTKGAKPNWKWYGAIPTANIKSYSLKDPPPPAAVPAFTNEQAPNPQKETKPSSEAAQRT